jgi:phage shock protein C
VDIQGKRLYRSKKDRMLGGVCSGLAEYFAVDPTLVRVILVILALMGGPGILIYFIMWIVMPERPADVQSSPAAPAVSEPVAGDSVDAKAWAEEQLRRTEGVDPAPGAPQG